MRQGNCKEHQYLAALRFAREDYKEETEQSRVIDFLEKCLDHYLASRVRPFSSESVSARVAGVFGQYKTLTGHEVLLLLTIAKGIWLWAHAAIVRRVRTSRSSDRLKLCPTTINAKSGHSREKAMIFA
jgi:hypothetical protein